MATTSKRGWTMHGSEDLIKFLGNFASEIEDKMLDDSVRSAANLGIAKPIKANIQSLFKMKSGNLLKGVKVGKVKGAPPGNIRVFMGPPAYHAHFFEFGTVSERPIVGKSRARDWKVKLRYTRESLKPYRVKELSAVFGGRHVSLFHTGGIKRTPFYIPGVYDNRQKAAEELKEQLRKRIAKYITGTTKR